MKRVLIIILLILSLAACTVILVDEHSRNVNIDIDKGNDFTAPRIPTPKIPTNK